MILLLVFGCSENGFNSGERNRSIAISHGDFDDFTPALSRLNVAYATYEGIISNATWSEDDIGGAPVENLLLNNEARLYEGLWLSSGTRGLGRTVYNRNEPDDQLIADEDALSTARRLVDSRKNLLVTDWAYDLAEQAWPDWVEYYGDDAVFDGAQVGDVGTVIATVEDPRLVESLGMEQVVLEYNFSNWAVITEVDPEATVWLRGDVRAWNGEAYEDVLDVPLLVSFEPEGPNGSVVVMTFHGNAQPAALTDTLLSTVMGELPQARETGE